MIDMNLSPAWVVTFLSAGVDAKHWSDLGAATTSDSEIMAFARVHNYIVLTHDLDFGIILSATQLQKPSVIQLRSEEVSPSQLGPQVILALRKASVELEQGALISIDSRRIRLRMLPLSVRSLR